MSVVRLSSPCRPRQPTPPSNSALLACLPHIATFALSLTRETASADDLVQETFLRAFRARETFRPELDMRRWLFTICKNVFLREQERAQREPLALDAEEPTDETMGAIRLHIEIRAAGESVMFDHAGPGRCPPQRVACTARDHARGGGARRPIGLRLRRRSRSAWNPRSARSVHDFFGRADYCSGR